ncbi:Crp/Fnr family transcriptional regulator [Sphingobacterium sp. SRCM116780]|uniref:Crp/Fnr family transcriptional regulator n=1 Tax=Sphingobacterium sp. SRCM116780 TaxID=2907623 RepID=UPI001F193E28|nr:Crp/Fnr family transcriptional regulator [Sphingobacterium sp. SRCM116780]UIR55325.1 Crp/Fnr family transcriptional regulator [Sphingobacterium sp. SRCM116780]
MGEISKSLRECLLNYYPLAESDIAAIEAITTVVHIPRNTIIIQQDKLQHDIYLLSSGLARIYYEVPDREITLDFNDAGSMLMSINTYSRNQPGYENISILEDAILFKINPTALFKLYEENIRIANLGRKIAEYEFIKIEQRAMSKLFNSAQTRYMDLLAKYPTYINRIKLGYIASYLGISQVTLSRIRASIR